MSSRSRPYLWAFAFLLAAEAVLFWGALVRGETFAERDLQAYYRPAKALVAPLWRDSEGLPLWNPLFSSGQPFAANPEHEIFHPMTALFLVLPFETAFRAQVLLPPLAGGWAAFLLARALRRSREAASLGAVAWAFGGYLLSATNLLPILLAASILPAVLAFAVRCARRPRRSDVAGLALTTALVGLAGEPSTLLMMPLLVLAALAHDRRPARGSQSSLVRPAVGFTIGLVLSAATIVPGLHHATKTVRAAGLDGELAGRWSFPPVRVAELLSPHVMGHVEKGDEAWYWGREAYEERRYPFLYSIYPGLCVTLLAILGAVRGYRRLWPWLGASAIGLLLATGVNGPIWDWVRRLPLLSGLRYPEKFILLLALPLVIVAVHGFDWTMGSGRWRRRTLGGALGLVLAIGLAAAAVISWANGLTPRPWSAFGLAPHLDVSFADVARNDALRVALAAAGGLLAMAVARRCRKWGALSLVAVTAADLALAGRAVIPSVPVEGIAAPPVSLAPLAKDPPAGPLFHLAAQDPILGKARGLSKPPIPAQWGLAMTLEQDFDLTFHQSSETARLLFWEAVGKEPGVFSQLLERRSVAAVLKFRTGVTAGNNGLRIPSGTTNPLELATVAAPRLLVFPAASLVPVDGPAGWVRGVLQPGVDVSRTIFLDPESARGLPRQPAPADISGLDVRPGRISFDVVAHGPAKSVLAVNQTWDEGWRLFVDGEPARLLLVDVSLSAVPVGPGHHHVVLVYRDPWVAAGLAATGLAILALAGILLIPASRWRPRPREASRR